MAKRFTDSAKWDKHWFRKLPPKYKVLWDYLYTKCNPVGVWDVDMETASHFVGVKVTATEALSLFKDQIIAIDGSKKWYLVGFIQFQYGELTPTNNFHRSLIAARDRVAPLIDEVLKSGAGQGLGEGSQSPIRIDKEKEKVKEQEEGVGETKPKPDVKAKHLDYVWLTPTEFAKLGEKIGPNFRTSFMERLNGYIGQIGEKKAAAKYTSHYHTVMNWYRADIEKGLIRPYSQPVKPIPKPVEKEPEFTEQDRDDMHYTFVDNIDKGRCRVTNCERCARRKKAEVTK